MTLQKVALLRLFVKNRDDMLSVTQFQVVSLGSSWLDFLLRVSLRSLIVRSSAIVLVFIELLMSTSGHISDLIRRLERILLTVRGICFNLGQLLLIKLMQILTMG